MKPVVFVPGLPGSELFDHDTGERLFLNLGGLLSTTARPRFLARLEGPSDPDQNDGVIAGEPIADVLDLDLFDLGKQAQSLYDILRRFGYQGFRRPFGSHFRAVGWDWRLPVDQAKFQNALLAAVDDLRSTTGQAVVLIVHSTGGLVLPSLLPALTGKVERVIAIGVPWAGTLKSFRLLAGRGTFFPLSRAETQRVLSRSWAAYDLLPPDPAKTPEAPPLFLSSGQPSSPLVARGWMPTGPERPPMEARADRSDQRFGRRSRDLRPLDVTAIAGWGFPTDTRARLAASGDLRFDATLEGDGTVPFVSASWLTGPGVTNFAVPIGFYPDASLREKHATLWSTPPAQDLLAEVLGVSPHQEYAYAAVDADDAINQRPEIRVRFVALDGTGRPLPTARARFLDLNGPGPTTFPLQPDGRGEVPVPRNRIRVIQGGRLLRFQLEIDWNGGANSKGPLTFAFPS